MCLVLPRHALDACLGAWLRSAPHNIQNTTPNNGLYSGPNTSTPSHSHTSHAALVLQPDGPRLLALPGPLQPGPPQRLPAAAHRPAPGGLPALQRPWPTGLLLLYLAPPGEPAPDAATPGAAALGFTRWLARTAPEHRLASPALQAG